MAKRDVHELKAELAALNREHVELRAKRRKLEHQIRDANVKDVLPPCFHAMVEEGTLTRLDVSISRSDDGPFFKYNIEIKTMVYGNKEGRIFYLHGADLEGAYDSAVEDGYFDSGGVIPPFDCDDNEPASLREAWNNVLVRINDDAYDDVDSDDEDESEGDDFDDEDGDSNNEDDSEDTRKLDSNDAKIFRIVLVQVALYCYCKHDEKSIRDVFPETSLEGIRIPELPPRSS